MKKLVRTAIIFLLYALIFVLFLDPGDVILRLKIPLFVLIFALWGIEKLASNTLKFRADTIILISIYLLIPILGICLAYIQGNLDNVPFALGFLKSVLILNLLFIVDDYDLRIDKMLINTSIVLPVFTIFLFISFLIGSDYFTLIFPFLTQNDVAGFAFRNYYGFSIAMFFFKTSPLLVFPLGYHTHKFLQGNKKLKHFLLAAAFLFTLFLSGTRANMLAGLLVFVLVILYELVRKKKVIHLLAVFGLVSYLAILFISKASFNEKEASQEVKGEHVTAYFDLFDEHPQYLVWGQGLGSEFYSKGFGRLTVQTELTYFDIVRMFGVPLGVLFILAICLPLIFLGKVYSQQNAFYLIIVFSAYLFIAGTNPLLISSTGILAILSIFSSINAITTFSNKRSEITHNLNYFGPKKYLE